MNLAVYNGTNFCDQYMGRYLLILFGKLLTETFTMHYSARNVYVGGRLPNPNTGPHGLPQSSIASNLPNSSIELPKFKVNK